MERGNETENIRIGIIGGLNIQVEQLLHISKLGFLFYEFFEYLFILL